MLMNATLLRIDDPPPASPGPAIAVRCSMGSPTASESGYIGAMGMAAARVIYVPMGGAAPTAGQHLTVRPDGCPETTWAVVYVADHVGGVLTHLQVFLESV